MSADVKRIAVFGTESTGKTWLAERLARHFGVEWVPEYAREFWEQNGGVIGLEDMVPIAREQWRREDAAAARAERMI
ncbi:MAG TPA: ATP-binding protein, partial [Opitutus sp.]|nr:ATP-binding protein [Opitutus sp.]